MLRWKRKPGAPELDLCEYPIMVTLNCLKMSLVTTRRKTIQYIVQGKRKESVTRKDGIMHNSSVTIWVPTW
jgi:hypothetical protein